MKRARWSLTRRAMLSIVAFAFATPFLWPLDAAAQAPQARIEAALANLEWREMGPTIMSGRVADLAVVESNPSIFYVGAASGGVWKTVNRGTTFEPVFDNQPTASIGDVTVAPSNPNIVWVGTGEPQNRQSSPWGNGAYKSTDAGRTWTHMGLTATHHISRIQIHPRDPNVVYVAAVGRLWGANPERGVYKTTDGGASWSLALSVDEHTGAIDLAMDHNDPQTLFAAMYQRRRTPWGFNGGGPGSGLYRTTDGGANWTRLTKGLPDGDLGRIGVDIYRRDGNLVFAIVEADAVRPGQGFGGGGGDDRERKNGVYRSSDRGETWEQVSTTNNRPMYYSQIRIDPNDPERLYAGGANLYKSVDGGRTFTSDAARGVHLDHHALWIDPSNSDHLILGSDGGVSISWDRTDTWRQFLNLPISQFYEIGADMRDPYHVCGGLQDNGSWCAPSDTRSNQGIRTKDWYNVGSGDGFYTVMHPTNARIMFAESQGGNLTRVDLTTGERTRMRPASRQEDEGEDEEDDDLRWNWNSPVVLSAHDPSTVYIGANMLFKSTDLGMSWQAISGDLTRQIDRRTLSIMGVRGSEPMLSANDGTASFGNLTTVSESPLNRDVIYTGSDDGVVSVTRDGGATWSNVTGNVPGLPDQTYVSRLVASRFEEGTVYATFDGHQADDFKPYVYISTDYGRRWRPIVNGLPEWSVNIIAQHHRNPDLVFVGNEIGVYVSADRGGQWVRMPNLATVPVDDIVVHPRENDLIIGTHGRGIWIMSDITPLEHLTPSVLASTVHIFPVRAATSYNLYTPQGWTPSEFEAPNPPAGALIRYYLRDNLSDVQTDASGGMSGVDIPDARAEGDSVRITIVDAQGATVRELGGPNTAGIHEIEWDLRLAPPYEQDEEQGGGGFFGGGPRGPKVLPGTYTARLDVAGSSVSTEVRVRLDPRVEISQADLHARQDALMSAYRLAKPLYEARQAAQRLGRQLSDVNTLLRGHDGAPESLRQEVTTLRDEVRDLSGDINRAGAGARSSFAIEGSTTRPTADQLWQLEQAWTRVPELIAQLNTVITDRMPAIYRQLDQHGIRPDPGSPVTVPRRSGSDR